MTEITLQMYFGAETELRGSVQASLPVEEGTGGSRSGVFVAGATGFLSPGDKAHVRELTGSVLWGGA